MSEEVLPTNTSGTNNTYWKSLNELAKNEEYQKFVEREFPENATELSDNVSRRSFLKVMGASIALAGFASCRRPVQKILPYSEQPEDVVPGKPLFYASAMPFQDTLTGLVIENHEGRPTKIEGNSDHPASRGASSLFNQAAVLGMYDPDRSRSVRRNGDSASWDEFVEFCAEHFAQSDRNILFISEASSSPTYNRLKQQALDQFTNAEWITYEPFGEDNALEGTNIAFGERLRTVNHFDNANIIVAFDDDFMNPAAHKNSVENTSRFAQGRKVESVDDTMSRFYAIESSFTLTGSNADNRLRLKSSEIPHFIYAIAARLAGEKQVLSGFGDISNEFIDHEWVAELAEDLLANEGASVLTVGPEHSPEVHAAVATINYALGNVDQTVTYHRAEHLDDENNREKLVNAVETMRDGVYDTVVLTGTNPVFDAPADLNFEEALEQVETRIHLADFYDETSRSATWHVNRAHFLEAWGDGFSFTGRRSVIQPQIQPLFGGKSEIEYLHAVLNGESANGYDLVRETWQEFVETDVEERWTRALHDGLDSGDAEFEAVSVSLDEAFASQAGEFLADNPSADGMELVIRPDSTIYDGRYANNGWLQELPDPMTKITWDNVALISPATARELGLSDERSLGDREASVIRIETQAGNSVEIPAWIQPGHADNSITVTVGYGRRGIGRVADEVGVDTYPLRSSEEMFVASNIEVEVTGQTYEIACTQDHHSLEGRDMVREATLEQYREDPDFARYRAVHGYEVPGIEESEHEENGAKSPVGQTQPISLFNEHEYPDHEPQWGMAIDLNACVGCGVCVVACQAENNIPVIGKREVKNGREMHWIRNDRYFGGDEENPQAVHQPVPCMHCELAPCEQVCPVAATTHSEDGMNQMTYNRCIGTRYCANNCPYKVRRFNFFNYPKEYLTTGDDPEIIQMAMNPDVSVRFRGVMEKCTYCVQRVNRAKIEAKTETGSPKPEDGSVETACQQACPADAIYFGDLTDNNSQVVNAKLNERDYVMLEETNTRPRTSYLAKLRNPNPNLA